ncbi:MAG: hypothetical protein JST00_48045 [Deltaproteobacteria bacterium]|nr:hypothetical protein [Deltaproteobacteria bacterium]
MHSHRFGHAGLAIAAGLLSGLAFLAACGSGGSNATCSGEGCVGTNDDPTQPRGGDGGGDGGDSPRGDGTTPGRPDDGIQNGSETDVDCGGPAAPKCAEGRKCAADSDCTGACSYAKRCVDAPSCKPRLGGDTCGTGEVGQATAKHESCCKTLKVPGFTDPTHPGKAVYLDKYEITAGRVRAFLAAMNTQYAGRPNVRAWVTEHPPTIWDPSWSKFLPSDVDGETIVVDRNLIGDPRGTWPGAPPVPATDEPRKTGTDFQFNGSLFMYLHGNNCSTHTNAYGFPTWFYPANVLSKMGPEFAPRADGLDFAGAPIVASEHLDVKAMNCITNAMLAAFCAWDGGQLATSEVLDFVTDSPPTLGNKAGCGTQIAEDPPHSPAAISGGRCADLAEINATYDAGGTLPQPGSPLNVNNYVFPFFAPSATHDKAWEIAAPGRGTEASGGNQVDQVRINAGDEPWVDLAGNLSEAVLTTTSGTFSGKFGLKYRGIGYQSARSQLNLDPKWDDPSANVARIERPQAKAGFAGGRCMRFK